MTGVPFYLQNGKLMKQMVTDLPSKSVNKEDLLAELLSQSTEDVLLLWLRIMQDEEYNSMEQRILDVTDISSKKATHTLNRPQAAQVDPV